MEQEQEEREKQRRREQRHESFVNSEVVKSAGFEEVPVMTTGIGNIVDYLNKQNPEDGTCMKIYEQNEAGDLRQKRLGFPTVQGALDLIVEAYEGSDVAAFVGMGGCSARENTHEGVYFRAFFRPQKNEKYNCADEDLYKGRGATKAY